MAVSACFLDLGNAQRGEGTQPCCRERGPPCGWVSSREHRKQSPASQFLLVCFQLPPQLINRRPLFKPVTAGGRGRGVFTDWPPGRQRPRGARASLGGRLPGREKDSPRGEHCLQLGGPKCFADNRMRLNNAILCTSRWDDGAQPLSPAVGDLGGGQVHTSCSRMGWETEPGVRETAVPGSVSVGA